MSRTPGSRNRDHDETRQRLVHAMLPVLFGRSGPGASMRDLASAANVTVPTLTHYFGDKQGAWVAALEALGQIAAVHITATAQAEAGAPRESMRFFVDSFVQAWVGFGVGTRFCAGLQLGLYAEAVGPAFLDAVLEPVLQAAEARLERHVARGELPAMDTRAASLALLSPIVLGLLHQGPLGGSSCRPLDVPTFVDRHFTAWARGWELA